MHLAKTWMTAAVTVPPLQGGVGIGGMSAALSRSSCPMINPEDIWSEAFASVTQVLTITATQHVFEDEVTPHSLGLDPRDVNLFNNAKGQGNQRATIEPRELCRAHEPSILFCTEIARAIIYKDKTVLFPHR